MDGQAAIDVGNHLDSHGDVGALSSGLRRRLRDLFSHHMTEAEGMVLLATLVAWLRSEEALGAEAASRDEWAPVAGPSAGRS